MTRKERSELRRRVFRERDKKRHCIWVELGFRERERELRPLKEKRRNRKREINGFILLAVKRIISKILNGWHNGSAKESACSGLCRRISRGTTRYFLKLEIEFLLFLSLNIRKSSFVLFDIHPLTFRETRDVGSNAIEINAVIVWNFDFIPLVFCQWTTAYFA